MPAVFRALRQPFGRIQRCAGGNSRQNALAPHQRARRLIRLLLGHRFDAVVHVGIQNLRHKPGADALQAMRTGRFPGQHRRAGRLRCGDLYRRILLFEIPADAGQGAAVPTPATNQSSTPAVSPQISGPVEA